MLQKLTETHLRPRYFYYKRTLSQVFSRELRKNFMSSFIKEHQVTTLTRVLGKS